MPTLAALKRSRRDLHARFSSLAQSDQPDLSACTELCAEIGQVDLAIQAEIQKLNSAMERARAALTIGVFRQHQPSWVSPCQLADPCDVCKAHEGRKKLKTQCPKARPNDPAFRVPVKTAIGLVRDGLAEFINRGKAIRLTFSRLANFRDRSAKIDERFLIAYAAGERWARNLFSHAWDGRACIPVS